MGKPKVLKGKFTVTGPSEMLTFAFDKLAKIDKKAEHRTKTQKGVSVTLQELRSEGGEGYCIWTVGLLLEYPADGPKFEKLQSWLAGNEIHLVRDQKGKKLQSAPNLGYETDDQSENRAIIRYRFGDEPDKNISLGAFADWTLVYKTPGGLTVLPVPFEFKDVQSRRDAVSQQSGQNKLNVYFRNFGFTSAFTTCSTGHSPLWSLIIDVAAA